MSQENFSPEWFLLENHHGTSFEDLKAGLAFLRRKVESQKEGQLSFLKSNAGSVIDQLDTLMTLRDKFQLDVKAVGNEPTAELDKAIQNSIGESHKLFNDVLLRREKADGMRVALYALQRHRFLFSLPNSIIKNAQKEKYDIILSDYTRAQKLFGSSEVQLFKKVLVEVDQRVLAVREELSQKILKMPQSVDQQKKFIKALLNLELQQVDVKSDSSFEDPAWAAIEARASYLADTFQRAFEVHKVQPKPRDPQAHPVRVAFFEEITEIAASQLPDLWRLGQSYFTGELRGLSDPKPGNFKKIILTEIERMCFYLRGAVLPSAKSDLGWSSSATSGTAALQALVPCLPQCLQYLRIAYATLIHIDLPSEVLDIVQKLIDEMRLHCMSTICRKAVDKVKLLEDKEEYKMCVPDFPGATQLPLLLRGLLQDMLDECQTACIQPEIRENTLLEPQSEGAHELSQRVQEILDKFATVIESLAFKEDEGGAGGGRTVSTISQLVGCPASTQNGGGGSGGDDKAGSNLTWEQKLLCCMANCVYCDRLFFKQLEEIFTNFNINPPRMAIESGRESIQSLFQSLLDNFVEMKSDPLVGTIEPSMYLGRFQWDTVRMVTRIRPYASECCDNLTGVYAEILVVSPLLLRLILEPIVQMVAEELNRLMSCVTKFSKMGAMQAALDIMLVRDALRLYSNSAAKGFFTEALEVLPTVLTDTDEKTLAELLKRTKQSMKLQLMCFTVANP